MQERSLFSAPFPAFIVCRLFDDGHSDWCEVISHCSFDLHFCNNEWYWASFLYLLANSLITSSNFLIWYVGFLCTVSCHLQSVRGLLLFLSEFLLFLFSSLIAVARTSKTMLSNSGKSGHACLVPDLRGNAFSFFFFFYHSEQCLLNHFSHVQLCATPPQAPSSLRFSRQEHWSGLPFPSPMHESEKWKWSCSVVSDS